MCIRDRIQAIIDEDIKAVDGSRIRLRLLDDVEIDECVGKRGTYPVSYTHLDVYKRQLNIQYGNGVPIVVRAR